MVDPVTLQDRRVTDNENFLAQISAADVVLRNKADCSSAAQRYSRSRMT